MLLRGVGAAVSVGDFDLILARLGVAYRVWEDEVACAGVTDGHVVYFLLVSTMRKRHR